MRCISNIDCKNIRQQPLSKCNNKVYKNEDQRRFKALSSSDPTISLFF